MAKLLVGSWPYPLTDDIIALLQPAADLGGERIEYGPGWTTWTVHDDLKLVGAAHCRRTTDRAVEVVLVGGHGFRDWIGPLDERIGAWARDEGATVLRAFGRRGWARVIAPTSKNGGR